jgi:hypothetical protein
MPCLTVAIKERSVVMSTCLFAFISDDDGFACRSSRSMEISNLALSQSNANRHADSIIGKMEANCHVRFVVEDPTTL